MVKQEQSLLREPRTTEAKLAAISIAAHHSFPTADIRTMLAEIGSDSGIHEGAEIKS